MTSVRSGDVAPASAPRPFYREFAWAYDYLIERPVAGECAGIEAMEYAGTYEGAPLGVGDRIVVAASLGAR